MKDFIPISVKPSQLPSKPLSDRANFPTCSCVYFAQAGKDIVYVGKTKNLRKRWKNHHRFAQLEKLADIRIGWMAVTDPWMSAIEQDWIWSYKPSLNNSPNFSA